MISNNIAYWRSTMNEGKGVSQAHVARKVGVGRSFVTKLEKGTAQPGAELMFSFARYFKQPVDAIFQQDNGVKIKPVIIYANTIPERQSVKTNFTTVPAEPLCNSPATSPARPAGAIHVMDKSLVSPAAKAVASPVAQASHRKIK
jgi:putative transcriptional regulator